MSEIVERICRVKLRARELQQKRETRLIGSLSTLCIILSFLLVTTIQSMMGYVQGKVKGTYGAMLLDEDAGGYILVAVITFAVATIITVLCIRYREKKADLEMEEKK